MELTIIKYNDFDKPNKFIVMVISDCDELYRVEKIYRNNGYGESFHIGKLLDIRDNKMYQNKNIIGNVEVLNLDHSILELVKNQIYLEQDIIRKTSQLKHIDDLLLYNDIFIENIYCK
jgi:hypothetical protein